jgi:hypothetical protein
MTRSSAKLRVVGTGHRSYIDNVTLISTRVLRAPLAKGHRQRILGDCLRHRATREPSRQSSLPSQPSGRVSAIAGSD